MNDSGDGRSLGSEEARARQRIERALRRARIVLLWEAVWPVVAPILVLAALFAVVSWFGLWRIVPDAVRIAVLVLFAVAALVLAWHAFRVRRPGRLAALARVEQATGALHRPATAFTDRLAVGERDRTAEALWAAHRTRLLASLERVRAGLPAPGLARRDPTPAARHSPPPARRRAPPAPSTRSRPAASSPFAPAAPAIST